MVTTKQAIDGLIKYIDSRIVPVLPASKAMLVGGSAILLSRNAQAVEDMILKKVPMLQELGIYKDGMWDTQQLYDCYASQIRGRFDLELPIIGTISLDREEADALFRCIGG